MAKATPCAGAFEDCLLVRVELFMRIAYRVPPSQHCAEWLVSGPFGTAFAMSHEAIAGPLSYRTLADDLCCDPD